ncbi:MAG: hypothetical protein KA403_03115 [Candidatus Omnitrophica bacterium]|nr:hypothetical protein [Candidatus Omnitrophota bacterium]
MLVEKARHHLLINPEVRGELGSLFKERERNPQNAASIQEQIVIGAIIAGIGGSHGIRHWSEQIN